MDIVYESAAVSSDSCELANSHMGLLGGRALILRVTFAVFRELLK